MGDEGRTGSGEEEIEETANPPTHTGRMWGKVRNCSNLIHYFC